MSWHTAMIWHIPVQAPVTAFASAKMLERARAGDPARRYDLEDLLVVHPTQTPPGSALVQALDRAVGSVLGRSAEQIANPGTYDQKHFARLAGVEHTVAYGPGILDLAHQVDECGAVDDLVTATKVLAVALADPGQAQALHSETSVRGRSAGYRAEPA